MTTQASPTTLALGELRFHLTSLQVQPDNTIEQQDLAQSEIAWTKFLARVEKNEVTFYKSIYDENISQLTASSECARKILDTQQFTDVLFLGIGGSCLGPKSALEALEHRRQNQLRFHFIDNVDPIDWDLRTRQLDRDHTLIVCVTKSGTTFETLAQFQIAWQWIQYKASHVVCITDPIKGDLRTFAKLHSITTLDIEPGIGGRFSIFSPVGLFALELAGLDAYELIEGAQGVHQAIEHSTSVTSPLHQLARYYIRHASEYTTHVMMPYSTRLKFISEWFVQLWGESLGKNLKGFTPLASVGATDQHSLLQLLRDGPRDKVINFITIQRHLDRPYKIPKLPDTPSPATLPSFSNLWGSDLETLLSIEQQAIARVMTNQKRPHWTLELPTLDEKTIGALYFFYSCLTALTGECLGVNPFDQPGVEEGKIYILESLLKK